MNINIYLFIYAPVVSSHWFVSCAHVAWQLSALLCRKTLISYLTANMHAVHMTHVGLTSNWQTSRVVRAPTPISSNETSIKR